MSVSDHLLLFVVVGLTSLLILLAARRRDRDGMTCAIVAAVEVVGATVVIFVANLAVGVILVLALRRLTPLYPSLYEVADVALLIISLLQALVVERWRRAGTSPVPAAPGRVRAGGGHGGRPEPPLSN